MSDDNTNDTAPNREPSPEALAWLYSILAIPLSLVISLIVLAVIESNRGPLPDEWLGPALVLGCVVFSVIVTQWIVSSAFSHEQLKYGIDWLGRTAAQIR